MIRRRNNRQQYGHPFMFSYMLLDDTLALNFLDSQHVLLDRTCRGFGTKWRSDGMTCAINGDVLKNAENINHTYK